MCQCNVERAQGFRKAIQCNIPLVPLKMPSAYSKCRALRIVKYTGDSRLPAPRLCAHRSPLCTNLGNAPVPRRALAVEPKLDIRVSGIDELAEGGGVRPALGLKWHVPHAFTAPLEESCRILEHCPAKEGEVDLAFE